MATIGIRSVLLGLLACFALTGLDPRNATAVVGCLTYDEARKIWPREHLYWHTAARCWDTSSPAEYRARARPKPERWISASGFAEATQYSLFIERLAEASPPHVWISAISWCPTSHHSFESKWNEDIMDLAQLAPGSQAGLFATAVSLPLRQAAAYAGRQLN
jgi:hypothetical protein